MKRSRAGAGPFVPSSDTRTAPFAYHGAPRAGDTIRPVDAEAAESLLAFAEQTVPGLRGLDGKAVSDQLEQRHGDLLEALR